MISSPAFNVSMLSHSSYIVVLLPPPMMLSLVHIFGQCGFWYSVHCRIYLVVKFLYGFYFVLIMDFFTVLF